MLKLEELEVYQLSMMIGDEVWEIVLKWNSFAKQTVGRQLVEATDSIASNIAEGYGRYHFKENKQFCYYSRGSMMETKTFLRKSIKRRLLSEEKFQSLMDNLELCHKKLNSYIKSIGKTKS